MPAMPAHTPMINNTASLAGQAGYQMLAAPYLFLALARRAEDTWLCLGNHDVCLLFATRLRSVSMMIKAR